MSQCPFKLNLKGLGLGVRHASDSRSGARAHLKLKTAEWDALAVRCAGPDGDFVRVKKWDYCRLLAIRSPPSQPWPCQSGPQARHNLNTPPRRSSFHSSSCGPI